MQSNDKIKHQIGFETVGIVIYMAKSQRNSQVIRCERICCLRLEQGYGHMDANACGFNHLVMAVGKSQQSECNSSGYKTHKRQEPCVMAPNIDKRPGAKLDGSGMVYTKLRVGV